MRERLVEVWRQFWWDRSLATKFVTVYFIVSLVLVAALVWRSGSQIASAIEEEIEHELEIEAFIIAGTLGKDFEDMYEYGQAPGRLLALMQQLGEGTESRISFYDRSLNLVFSTDPRVQPHQTEMTTEIAAALANSEQHAIRYDPWTQEERLFAAAPVFGEEHLLGVVQISIPWRRVQTRILAEWTTLLFTGGVAILLNTLLSLFLARSIVRPLRELTQAARDLAGGRLDRRVPVRGRDEVGTLAVAFNEMAARLQEMIERERLFIANASHELRSPLTSIQLRAEMLREETLPPERRRRYIEELHHEAQRLHRLAERLLNLSRLNMRPETEALHPVDAVAVARHVVDAFSLRAARKGVTLTLDVPEEPLWILATPEGLQEILMNLVDNALKHTPSGGRVSVRVQAVNGQVQVQVADTGEGIPEADIPHIFEPFYRVDKARSRRQGGSGLGLSIVKRLVDLYGGRIEVQSTLGQGTQFTLIFPATSP